MARELKLQHRPQLPLPAGVPGNQTPGQSELGKFWGRHATSEPPSIHPFHLRRFQRNNLTPPNESWDGPPGTSLRKPVT